MDEFDRTTFVIGAGASVDFGFPTGNDLIQTISWLADSLSMDGRRSSEFDHQFFRNLLDAAHSQFSSPYGSGVNTLARRVSDGLWLSTSIDNFLNEQRDDEVAKFGKFLIVASILLHERYQFPKDDQTSQTLLTRPNLLWSALCDPATDRGGGFAPLRSSWLVPFFRAIRGQGGVGEFGERLEKLTLIIFNYDRSVEFFLHQAMMTYDQMNPDEASEFLQKIQIIHPYETAARLPFQDPFIGTEYGGIDDASFTNLLDREPLIQTFAEPSAGKGRADAQEAIRLSKNLIFMGFGFLEQNLIYLGKNERLVFGPNCRRSVYTTTYGLSDFQRNRNLNRIKGFQFADTREDMRSLYTEVGRIMHLNGTSSELIAEFSNGWF